MRAQGAMSRACDAARRSRGGVGRLLHSAVLALMLALPVTAPLLAQPAPQRINPTGRIVAMSVPLKESGNALGEAAVRLLPDDTVEVAAGALKELIGPLLTEAERQRLAALIAAASHVTTARLASAGFDVRFDPGLLELAFHPRAEQRPTSALGGAGRRRPTPGPGTARPATWSAFANFTATTDYAWADERSVSGLAGTRFDIEAVGRFWGMVAETELVYETAGDTSRDIYGRSFNRFQVDGLKRRGSRLVYDLPEDLVRITAGDTRTLATGFQRTSEVLGLTVERSLAKMAPGEAFHPTGAGSFRLEQPATIEIIVNGSLVRQLRLGAGIYQLSDLPLTHGGNDIEIAATDDSGVRRSHKFRSYLDQKLLAPGASEWSATVGVPSYLNDSEVMYLTDIAIASAAFRTGLSERLTGEAQAQADTSTGMAGIGLAWQSSLGLFAMNGSASQSRRRGPGVAGSFAWGLPGFRGLTGGTESLHLAAELKTRNFATPGDIARNAELAVSDPRFLIINPYLLRLSAAYSFPVTQLISGTLSGRYQIADDRPVNAALAPFQVHGDRYSADLTLAAPLSDFASMSLTAGYGNEAVVGFSGVRRDDGGGFRAALRVLVRPEERTSIAAGYDTITGSVDVSGHASGHQGIDRWSTSVQARGDTHDRSGGLNAALELAGNRGEVQLSHSAHTQGEGYRGTSAPLAHRSTLRIATAIAVADGHVAISRPIRGGGFAILAPHESIADREVTAGMPGAPAGRSDLLGPAVVTDIPAFAPMSVPVDVADLPIGYSLGTGTFDLLAPYRAGYALEVGSAYSVSAFGTLLSADGAPIGLLTGVAHRADDPSRRVEVFTNATGRFGAEGLAPGRWIIEMATSPAPTRYLLDVPPGADGLVKVGVLRPISGS